MIGATIDLASAAMGGEVLAANDEFFAPKENLIVAAPPVWREGEYTERGKWMDGWETRRRREPGSDWALLRLGVPGTIDRVEIDTAHFSGNFPESAELFASGVGDRGLDDLIGRADWWQPLLVRSRLEGNHLNAFQVGGRHRITHVKLVIHPDGGVARLRVFGRAVPGRADVAGDVAPFSEAARDVEVTAVRLGSSVVASSDEFFGEPFHLLHRNPPAGMFDGWETRRRRGPGNDWVVIRLGLSAIAERFEVDTTHFKGNAPGWVSISGCAVAAEVPGPDTEWVELVPMTPVAADTVNQLYTGADRPLSHLRLDIHPDGGVARFRAWGRVLPSAQAEARMSYLNCLTHPAAESFFTTACSSRTWVNAMLAGIPYSRSDAVLSAAEGAFRGLDEADWLEVFAAHPRIGGGSGSQERPGEAMSTSEQAGVGTDAVIRERLAAGNVAYEQRHGFRYIVSAAGRSGQELLDLLEVRIGNDRETELAEAAAQQRAITRRRLQWMLCAPEREDRL